MKGIEEAPLGMAGLPAVTQKQHRLRPVLDSAFPWITFAC